MIEKHYSHLIPTMAADELAGKYFGKKKNILIRIIFSINQGRAAMNKLFLITAILLTSFSISFAGASIENASNEQINLIKIVLPEDINIEDSIIVKSSNHRNAYYIGVKLRGKGYSSSVIGLWLISGNKNKPSLLYSINDTAFIYSRMRMASETKAAAYLTDKESKIILKKLKTN